MSSFLYYKDTNNILNTKQISNIFTLIYEMINYYANENINSIIDTRYTHI
nr:MAG TPA: hypothetical protein [Caudoviricetes sp.]